MDLLEYQAKELFEQVGIPILPSQPISDPTELKHLQIPYPVVLKSQVASGGRGKAGGIRFVNNTIDAIAVARMIFNLPISGEYPMVLLAEAHYQATEEIFLAVLLDYQLQAPVLLGSRYGGIEMDNLLKHLQRVPITGDFSPFYARRLAVSMGLEGSLIISVTDILEKMYKLFREKDLDLVEINPLGVSSSGEVMALDGKVTVNDHALHRHQEFPQVLPTTKWLTRIEQCGNVGIISNSRGVALATLDALAWQGEKVKACLIVEDVISVESWECALHQMRNLEGIKVIILNMIDSPERIETLLTALIEKSLLFSYRQYSEMPAGQERMLRETARSSPPRPTRSDSLSSLTTPLILRLVGSSQPLPILERLKDVYRTESLAETVSCVIAHSSKIN